MNGGKTALHLAVAEGFTHIVELLLQHSPDLEVRVRARLVVCVYDTFYLQLILLFLSNPVTPPLLLLLLL